MTSTSFNVGLGDEAKLSSRVLRPPGGGHTDIFGGEPEPPQTGRRGPPTSSITFDGHEPAKPTNGTAAPTQNGDKTPAEAPTPEAAAAPPAQAEPPRAEAPKRVRVPPGGFSSGLW